MKLNEQAGMFRHYFIRKEYVKAALCREWAGMVSLFVDWDGDRHNELFGTRQPDEPIEGLIKEEYYIKALDWCVFHGYAQTIHTYQNVQTLL